MQVASPPPDYKAFTRCRRVPYDCGGVGATMRIIDAGREALGSFTF